MLKYPLKKWLILLVGLAAVARGDGQMRRFQPIRTPGKIASALPKGAKSVENIRPVSMKKARKAMEKLVGTWGTPAGRKVLAESFYDKSRYGDAMSDPGKVPRDARLRLLSIRSVRTLKQAEQPLSGGLSAKISIVEVRATTQIEFNDPQHGFVRLEGTNDYTLEVREKAE